MDYKKWYAIFVMTGREDAVKRDLERLLLLHSEVNAAFFVPKRLTIDKNAKGETETLRLLFPGYVLVGTKQIEQVFTLANGVRDIYRFLRAGDEEKLFQQIELAEIMRIIDLCDDNGIIGESTAILDENEMLVVTSDPLKGEKGYITKYDRRKGRVLVSCLLGTEWTELWLAVRVERKTEK
jgi:transcriptional antiterminator NusG